MIAFDPTKLEVTIVGLKSISQALGGSISIIDPVLSTDRKEVTIRFNAPSLVLRSYLKIHKFTRYLKPMVAAIVRYEGHIVSLERHPLGGFGEELELQVDGSTSAWVPMCKRRIEVVLNNLPNPESWFFDGRFVYQLKNELSEQQAVRQGAHLNANGSFRKIDVNAIDLFTLPSEPAEATSRTCLAFVTSTGVHSISPPVWKNLSDVGMTQFKKQDKLDDMSDGQLVEDSDRMKKNFDRLDATMGVNLNFVLTAGRVVGRTFGYDYIEPLQLPRLMIELHTVNLPNVASQVKATYDIGVTFSEAMAWLLGLMYKANTLDSYRSMSMLMKYLTSSGIFRLSLFDASLVFQPGKTTNDIVKQDVQTLMSSTDISKVSISQLLVDVRRMQKAVELLAQSD